MTSAHPGPLSTPSAGPMQNKYVNDDLNTSKKKRKDGLSTTLKSTTGEQASTSSMKLVKSPVSMQLSVENDYAVIPGPSHRCDSHPTIKRETGSDVEVSTSQGAVDGGPIHDDKVGSYVSCVERLIFLFYYNFLKICIDLS